MQWVINCYREVLGREPCSEDVERIIASEMSHRQLLVQLINSAEFCDILCREAVAHHQAIIHNTRIKLIKFFLPKADIILDIGGANGSLIEYGYPYNFQKLIITDLPPEDRIAELRSINLVTRWKSNPKVSILYNLNDIEDDSIEFAWAGQLVEHIEKREFPKFLSDIYRVLKPGGSFCLDTPNSLMARIHTPYLLHPEHKYEYNPAEMDDLLKKYFMIERRMGLIPMPISYETRNFSYQEMILNNAFSEILEHSYLMFFACRK
jgi:SAM-dependent methyltransferase